MLWSHIKKRLILVTFIALVFLSLTATAQSSDKILKQAVKALGGEKSLKRVTSWRAVGKLTRKSDAASGSYQAFASRPDLYAVTMNIGGFEVSEGYNGKSGWRRDSRTGLRTLTGQEGSDFRAEVLFRNARWFDAKKDGAEESDEDEDNNRGSITEMLQCSKLLNPRREQFRQRDLIVFDFEPAPTCNPKTDTGKMAQKLKLIGAFWIDPNDKQIARLEMRLGDYFKVAGGLLASIKSGSVIVFEQERVNNEIWLPTYEEFNIAIKVLLFKGLNANGVTRFRDYKKFKVEAEKEKLKLPVKP